MCPLRSKCKPRGTSLDAAPPLQRLTHGLAAGSRSFCITGRRYVPRGKACARERARDAGAGPAFSTALGRRPLLSVPLYPYYPPPPRRNDTLLIIVIVIVVLVAVPTIVAAILYGMVSSLLTGPGPSRPFVTFSTAQLAQGNATITVAQVSQTVSPSNYWLNLQVGASTGAAQAMPSSGSYASITIGGTTYRI